MTKIENVIMILIPSVCQGEIHIIMKNINKVLLRISDFIFILCVWEFLPKMQKLYKC